ncbi:MAG: hypothetical protein ABSG13_23795 [Bryobacteraceae bacterium]
MTFPEGFPDYAKAAVFADKIKATEAFEITRNRAVPMRPPGVSNQEYLTSLARRWIMRIFGVFAQQACGLGLMRSWTAVQVDDNCKEFLRVLVIDAHAEFGNLPIRKMTNDWGHITLEVWNEFKSMTQWKEYQAEFLKVAEVQMQPPGQETINTAAQPHPSSTRSETRTEPPSPAPIRNRSLLAPQSSMKTVMERYDSAVNRSAKPVRRKRLSSTITSMEAAGRLEEFLERSPIEKTDFASKVGITSRTLLSFRRTGKIKRKTLILIAKEMRITIEELTSSR